MSRRASHTRKGQNKHIRNKNSGSSSPFPIVAACVAALAIIGLAVWFLTRSSGYTFHRSQLDRYVALSHQSNLLDDRASVYVDMSDGMNFAYASPQSREMLQAIINKLAANSAIDFYGLADSRITPLELSHTALYNYMLNPASYDKQRAPIQATLDRIVNEKRPALLLTDFEEYKGGVIEQAAYAKEAFIKWLAAGYNIMFYKWDFTERGKGKHMFLAIFDDNTGRLQGLVENAVNLTAPSTEKFVLASRDFTYPTGTYPTEYQYTSVHQGGNHHGKIKEEDKTAVDMVTAVMENGGPEDYFCYAKPLATPNGYQDLYAPLDISFGDFAQYYPLGVSWKDAVDNARKMSDPNISDYQRYTHLLSNLLVDFEAQSDYGSGQVRKAALGSQYMPVQQRVNELKREGTF